MMNLVELAGRLGAEFRPATAAAGTEIRGVASPHRADSSRLVFAVDQASLDAALRSPAAAVLIPPVLASGSGGCPKPLLVVQDPKLAFARAARLLQGQAAGTGGIHATAILGLDIEIASGVSIEAYAVVGEGCRIGAGSVIGAGCVLGAGVVIGRHTKIYPRVVIYPGAILGDRVVVHAGAVLGADGFGYVRDPATGEYLQFPQQGTLVIEDNVEVGANTTIDRGALEETRIARGTKIDNLVHIGHNSAVGKNVVIAAQTGISGSCSIGDSAVLGGQVGMGDHAAVGEGVVLGGQAGVLPYKKLEGPGIAFWGTPAQPLRRYLKQLARMARLDKKDKPASPPRTRE